MPPTATLRRRTLLVAAVLGTAGLLAACGSSGGGAGTSAGAAEAPTASGAWARTSAAMQTAGAAYLTLENTTDADDALVKVSAAATVAATAEIHETVAADSVMADTTTMGGATTMAGGTMGPMKMQPVDRVVVPAKGKVELKPGGYHIMLLELPKPLVEGETFDLTLTFESGATSTVSVEVRDQA